MFWTFVEAAHLASGMVTVDGAAGHHLARVLRVRPRELGVIVVGGRQHEVEVIDVGDGRVVARVIGERPAASEPETRISLWQAVLPNPDFDSVIENGTAIGVRRFVPIQARRSVARPADTRLSRWKSIATSAAEQSHRDEIPSIAGPMTLGDALAHERDESWLLVLDPAVSDSLAGVVGRSDAYTLAVGPEGGWTADEVSAMEQKGGIRVTLGRRILRARLAPVIAAAILVQPR